MEDNTTINQIQQFLNQYWGYNSLRKGQQEIIEAALSNKDCLAILPTGGGKSICFQLPALIKKGLTLVVSPLIALMKDQIEQLNKKGIAAKALFSGLSQMEIYQTLQSATDENIKFLYLSPERLQTPLFLEYFVHMNIAQIVVDEAHCISQWGFDFRPPYLKIGELRSYHPHANIIAVTASANELVQKDIIEYLNFNDGYAFFNNGSFRKNLSYSCIDAENKILKLIDILNKTKGSTLVYCNSRKGTIELANILNQSNFNADYYHAGLTLEERNTKQNNWINNKTRIMTCTNAFGMGIDKPDVRLVVHYDIPESIEHYYQEAGRAGRDGLLAYAVLLVNDENIKFVDALLKTKYLSSDKLYKLYHNVFDYLQVAVNDGKNEYYNFNFNEFCKNFEWNSFEAYNGLKLIAAQGVWYYHEQIFNKPKISFTTGIENLRNFYEYQPEYKEIIQNILRLYVGILDYECNVNISEIAYLSNISVLQVEDCLNKLTQWGILNYSPAQLNAQIFIQEERQPRDFAPIDFKLIDKLKNQGDIRWQAIKNFALQNSKCRSLFIENYFNPQISTDFKCNVCDVCIGEKTKHNISPTDTQLLNEIIKVISENKFNTEQLLAYFKKYDHKKIKTFIDYLIEEKKIFYNHSGLLFVD